MAKSVSVLLAVLAVAFFLDGAQARGIPHLKFNAEVSNLPTVSKAQEDLHQANLHKFDKHGHRTFDNMEDAFESLDNDDDNNDNVMEPRSISTALPPGYYYIKVAGIIVGPTGSMLAINPETTGVIVSANIPFLILDKEAYGLLKNELPEGDATSHFLGAIWHQLCSTSATEVPVTLVLAVNNAEYEMGNFWYKQNDGSTCLAILPSPLA